MGSMCSVLQPVSEGEDFYLDQTTLIYIILALPTVWFYFPDCAYVNTMICMTRWSGQGNTRSFASGFIRVHTLSALMFRWREPASFPGQVYARKDLMDTWPTDRKERQKNQRIPDNIEFISRPRYYV